MANAINDNISYTYEGVKLLNPLFFEPVEDVPNPFDIFRFVPTKYKTQIHLPRAVRKIVQTASGCGRPAGTKNFDLNSKEIVVDETRADMDQCYDTFNQNIFVESLQAGTEIDNLSETEIARMVLRQFAEGWRSDLWRLSWFGDKAGASADYTVTDGFFKRFFAAITGTTIGYSLDMSTDATIEDVSGDLVADGAIVALRKIYENGAKTLRAIPKAQQKFMVTCTVHDNLMTTYENLGTDSGLARVEDGSDSLKFRGIDVVIAPEWDLHLADGDNEFNASVGKNAIVHTAPKTNLVYASDTTESSLRVRYSDDDDELMKVTGKIKIGTQVIEDSLVSFAY